MRKLLIAAMISLPLAATAAEAAPAPAAAPAATSAQVAKVVVVDIQQVLNQSNAAKDLKKQLEAKRKEYQSQISAKEATLKKTEADLIKQKNVLNKDDFAKKQQAFAQEVEKVRKDVQQKRISLDTAYKKAVGEIQASVQKIIEEMAGAQGFNMAIPTSCLLYTSDAADDM
jgi:outer membrane protein